MYWRSNEAAAQELRVCVPIRSCRYFMRILLTLLAKIFVGTRFFSPYSDASSVLPNLADVALHEKARYIIGRICRSSFDALPDPMFAVVVAVWRRPWIVFVATDASNSAVVFSLFFYAIHHFHLDRLCFGTFIISFVASSAFPTCLNCVVGNSNDGFGEGF